MPNTAPLLWRSLTPKENKNDGVKMETTQFSIIDQRNYNKMYEPPFRFKFISLGFLLEHPNFFPLLVRHSEKFEYSMIPKAKLSQCNSTTQFQFNSVLEGRGEKTKHTLFSAF